MMEQAKRFSGISAFALRTLAIVCMLLDHIGYCLPDTWTMTEAFALLALIPIFLYFGKKGFVPKSKIGAKALQIGFYLFYPVHMLLLWFLFVK